MIEKKYLPITDKWEYKILNPIGRCISAGKIQVALKTLDSIPIFNKDFTQQEYDEGTSIYLREPNGISCTKDFIWLRVDVELSQEQLNKIDSRLLYAKDRIAQFLD